MADAILTQERLKEILHYDPDTGLFAWIKKPSKKAPIKIGDKIKNKDVEGYLRVFFDCKYYKLHRLAWFYVYGVYPKYQIDHINGVKDDNRICNLRDVPQCVNMHNIHSINKNKKSGLHRGVYLESGRYRARIKINNKIVSIGSFDTEKEAIAAYIDAKNKQDCCYKSSMAAYSV